MSTVENSIQIQADCKKVYRAAKQYPLFVDQYKKKRILEDRKSGSRVRMTKSFYAIPLTWEGNSVRHEARLIKWVQTCGLLKGLKAKWAFEPISESVTRVTIFGTFDGKGFWGKILNPLAPALVKQATTDILNSLKTVAEK